MIKLLRVDDRLIHGAVGFSWTKQLSINMIILANDAIAKDDFQKMTLDIAKPRGTKLVCESVEKAKALIRTHLKSSTNVMVITNNIPDAADILTSIPEIGSLNPYEQELFWNYSKNYSNYSTDTRSWATGKSNRKREWGDRNFNNSYN